MTNESLHHDPSSLTDPELEQLLSDAYDVPPIPRSLLKRIDQAVESEWGASPELAGKPAIRWKEKWNTASRVVKSLPIAAMIALVVGLSVMLSGNSSSRAWAAMLDALERHGVVQVDGDGITRWLALSDRIVGERQETASRLIDATKRIELHRAHNEQAVRRVQFESPAGPTRDQLALRFLLGNRLSDSPRFANARIVSDQCESTQMNGREQVWLNVGCETATRDSFALKIQLDPQTDLPLSCEVNAAGSGMTAPPVRFEYPTVTAADLQEHSFPASLPVIDVAASEIDSTRLADSSAQQEEKFASNETVETAPITVDDITSLPAEAATNAYVSSFGEAASQWPAVEIPPIAGDQFVARADELLEAAWQDHHVDPTDAATSEEILRRVYLDLAGRTPGVNEVRSYLNDQNPNRYESLVDRLLDSPDHASHMATIWRTFLIPEGVDLDAFGGVEAFDKWLADRFSSNDSYDDVVRSLLLAEGRLSRSGPLLFYSAVKLDPDQLASRTARVFLGMRLECAQCHDHPFEPWSQEDFWSFAAFFAQISRPNAELETVSTVMRVSDVNRGEVKIPETDIVVEPKFLNGAVFGQDDDAARRQQLAGWLTSADNPYFARATANRVWGMLFGKGIVDPIDDFGTQHTPKLPELLDLLAAKLIQSDFQLRDLFRTVALTRAYRLSSGSNVADAKRAEWFAQMNVKTLTAEQVYDCITVATMVNSATSFSVERFGNSDRETFLQQFRTPAGRTTEYLGGIPQALTLMNGTLIDSATGLSSSGLLKSLEAPFFTNKQRVEVLYFATLSRRPRTTEWQLLDDYIPENASGNELREGLADVLWALLNSAEFTMNH